MKDFEKALVVVDKPKHEQLAIRRALRLREASAMQMEFAAFCYDPAYDQSDVFDAAQRRAIKKAAIDERKAWLQEQLSSAGASDAEVATVWTKTLADWVVSKVEQDKIELVVKSVHRSKTLMHTPADWHLLRYCQSPVLLCAKNRWAKRPRILVALDIRSSDRAHQRLNRKALDAAAWFAEHYGGEIHCVNAVEVSQVLSDLDLVDARKIRAETQEKAQTTLRGLLEPWDIPADRVHMPLGKVGHAVNNVAGQIKADLLIMGTTGRTGMKGLVIGNAAEKVLTRAGCDVLALKP